MQKGGHCILSNTHTQTDRQSKLPTLPHMHAQLSRQHLQEYIEGEANYITGKTKKQERFSSSLHAGKK